MLLAQCLKQWLKSFEFIRPSLVLHGYYIMLGKVICFGTDVCFFFSGQQLFLFFFSYTSFEALSMSDRFSWCPFPLLLMHSSPYKHFAPKDSLCISSPLRICPQISWSFSSVPESSGWVVQGLSPLYHLHKIPKMNSASYQEQRLQGELIQTATVHLHAEKAT